MSSCPVFGENCILPGDIVIKGPGFDERQDCKLSYNEKISLLTYGVADNNKIFLTARKGSNGKIIINRYSNVQESFGIKYEKISLPDNVLYNEIKLNNISEQKGILKHNL